MSEPASTAELRDARRRMGPIARREMLLALSMLAPTVGAVLLIVLVPLLANFWISVKPVELADLRAAKPLVRERVSTETVNQAQAVTVEYRLRSSSPKEGVSNVTLEDRLPAGFRILELPEGCGFADSILQCEVGALEPRKQLRLKIKGLAPEGSGDPDSLEQAIKASKPLVSGVSKNKLLSLDFTLDNFRAVFDADEFWGVLWVSIVYTIGGTGGALALGLAAAQLLQSAFPGRGILRGLFLFPYVSPVIAVAFTWVFLLDPFSGTVNALFMKTGVTEESINFLGRRGIALWTVIAFEAWRYFPLAFLFILARMQALSSDLYEAAEMDGATPMQQFWHISLPQLAGIISTLFLLRFIWTFNKFDDIFLLTGGGSGTRTLTVNVYEQAFALSNLGAGAAVAVVIFLVLGIFVTLYFKFLPKEEGM